MTARRDADTSIASTIDRIARQHYPGPTAAIVIDDGSGGGTATVLGTMHHPWL